jgi:magnesium chelatase family protein
MPPFAFEEELEVSKLYSICGRLPPAEALLSQRPFRAPLTPSQTPASWAAAPVSGPSR